MALCGSEYEFDRILQFLCSYFPYIYPTFTIATPELGWICLHRNHPQDVDNGPQCPRLCGWNETNSHGLPSPMEEKGQHGHSLKRRTPRPLPWQAFIVFLGPLHQRWSSFTKHRFVLGGYILQTTKERMLLNTSKEDICNVKGEMVKPTMFHTWTV